MKEVQKTTITDTPCVSLTEALAICNRKYMNRKADPSKLSRSDAQRGFAKLNCIDHWEVLDELQAISHTLIEEYGLRNATRQLHAVSLLIGMQVQHKLSQLAFPDGDPEIRIVEEENGLTDSQRRFLVSRFGPEHHPDKRLRPDCAVCHGTGKYVYECEDYKCPEYAALGLTYGQTPRHEDFCIDCLCLCYDCLPDPYRTHITGISTREHLEPFISLTDPEEIAAGLACWVRETGSTWPFKTD